MADTEAPEVAEARLILEARRYLGVCYPDEDFTEAQALVAWSDRVLLEEAQENAATILAVIKVLARGLSGAPKFPTAEMAIDYLVNRGVGRAVAEYAVIDMARYEPDVPGAGILDWYLVSYESATDTFVIQER